MKYQGDHNKIIDGDETVREDLAILFLHHGIGEVVKNNLRSIKKQNPDVPIITMSAGKPLGKGYSLEATPDIKQLHSINITRSSDWLVCSWFMQRQEKFGRLWIVEWDTFCTMSVKEYYSSVWHFPFVASSVRLPHRDPTWDWFSAMQHMPSEYRSYATGAVPFLYLMSERALRSTCSALVKKPFVAGNGEFRFSTVANMCGFRACGFSPPNDCIRSYPWKAINSVPAVFHPVKYLVPSECSI